MKPKHILVISQYFYPEAFRINDMCCEWVKRGYKVTVLTGIPNYPKGKFYKGYGWFKKRREQWNGMEIIRIPLLPRGRTSLGLALNYCSFVVSGFFWRCFTKLKADIVFTFEVSPMTQALVGVGYSKRRKIPHYIYVQDLWPDNVEILTGIHSPLVIKPLSRMVNRIYKNCDRIFATSPSFVREIQKRTPGEEDKVLYWPQYAEEYYQPLPKKPVTELLGEKRFKIIFTGNIGQAQGLDILPRTARYLKDQGDNGACFVIVGDGRHKQQLLDDIGRYDVGDMFILLGYHPSERVPELLAACDAAFVSFLQNEVFINTIPAKLQSYLACGMPVLAAASGETERIISEARCGLCCEGGNEQALAQCIHQLRSMDLSEYAANARAYFEANFQKKPLMDKMDEYLSKAIP